MEDIPPGMPPPPPVPYIAKVDGQGMHLCCPYMKMERPERFEGAWPCFALFCTLLNLLFGCFLHSSERQEKAIVS